MPEKTETYIRYIKGKDKKVFIFESLKTACCILKEKIVVQSIIKKVCE